MRVASCVIAAFLAGSAFQSSARLVNAITAVVHDAPVTLEQLERLMAQTEDELRRTYRRDPQTFQKKMEEARSENMKKLVSNELILHEFKTAGYSLPDSIVDDYVKQRIRDEFGDRQRATKTLQARGLTYEKYREQQKQRFIISAMRQKNIKSEIIISPHKIETHYLEHQDEFKVDEQVKLRMIQLNKTADGDAEAGKRRADEILTLIKQGVPFAELAKNYSDGITKKEGGDYAWTDRRGLRTELSQVAFSLEPGATSGVIETGEAYYILHLQEKRAPHVRPLAEVRADIESKLQTLEQARLETQWLDRLKKKTFITYFP